MLLIGLLNFLLKVLLIIPNGQDAAEKWLSGVIALALIIVLAISLDCGNLFAFSSQNSENVEFQNGLQVTGKVSLHH